MGDPQRFHTLVTTVENKPGVLARVAGLFARRGFNIESLAVAPTDDERFSCITFTVDVASSRLEQVVKQLDKLINVLSVVDLSSIPAVERELMLLKVAATPGSRSAIFDLVHVFRAKVVDVADEAVTLEVVGDPGKLVALERLMAPFGILEIARTGKVALERASGVNTELLKVTAGIKRVPA